MIENNVSILVSSYDGFSDCWEPFIHGYKKYWPNSKYKNYLITNELNSPDEHILKTIKVGEDLGWASNMLKALDVIDSKYIIYLQEDYWLNNYVNQKHLSSILEKMDENSWDYFRLIPIPGPDEIFESESYGRTTAFSKYRLCLQASIWKKEFLKSLLFEGESGWEFELKSSNRIKTKNIKSFSISKDKGAAYILSYCEGTAIRKAKWTLGAKKYINKEQISFDLSKREMESKFETVLLRISGINIFMKIVSFFILRSFQFVKGERSFLSIFQL